MIQLLFNKTTPHFQLLPMSKVDQSYLCIHEVPPLQLPKVQHKNQRIEHILFQIPIGYISFLLGSLDFKLIQPRGNSALSMHSSTLMAFKLQSQLQQTTHFATSFSIFERNKE